MRMFRRFSKGMMNQIKEKWWIATMIEELLLGLTVTAKLKWMRQVFSRDLRSKLVWSSRKTINCHHGRRWIDPRFLHGKLWVFLHGNKIQPANQFNKLGWSETWGKKKNETIPISDIPMLWLGYLDIWKDSPRLAFEHWAKRPSFSRWEDMAILFPNKSSFCFQQIQNTQKRLTSLAGRFWRVISSVFFWWHVFHWNSKSTSNKKTIFHHPINLRRILSIMDLGKKYVLSTMAMLGIPILISFVNHTISWLLTHFLPAKRHFLGWIFCLHNFLSVTLSHFFLGHRILHRCRASSAQWLWLPLQCWIKGRGTDSPRFQVEDFFKFECFLWEAKGIISWRFWGRRVCFF